MSTSFEEADLWITAKVVTGTSAGALVAAFLCTHTDDELRRMLIPQLAEKITACEEPFSVRPAELNRVWEDLVDLIPCRSGRRDYTRLAPALTQYNGQGKLLSGRMGPRLSKKLTNGQAGRFFIIF